MRASVLCRRRSAIRRRGNVPGFAWAFGLALTLLLAQTLGSLHRVAHGQPGAATRNETRQPASLRSLHGQTNPEDAHFAALFDAHQEDSITCELFDLLSHGDTLVALPTERVALSATSFKLAGEAPSTRAAATAWFLARAPPAGT